MYLFSRTIEHCNKTLHSFSTEKLNPAYWNEVKYACIKNNQEYYHNYFINYVKNLKDLSSFGDITIYSTYLKKYNLTLGTNHQNLYNLFSIFEDKLYVAVMSRDIIGFKNLGVNPAELIPKYISNKYTQVDYSIELDDIDTLKTILKKPIDNIKPQNLNFYLQIAYKHESLKIATYLISQGATFDLKYMLWSWMQKPFTEYLNHLDILLFTGNINQGTHIKAQSLLQAVYCKYTQDNTTYSELNSLIHTSSTKINISLINYNIITKSLFSLTIASNFPHFVIPITGYTGPFFKPQNIFYKIYIANPENSNFQYQFIHELTHAFLYLIFNNHGNPYFKDKEKEYKKAKDSFLRKFSEAIGYKYDTSEEKPLEKILSDNPQLNIHEYCITNNDNKKLQLFTTIYDNILLKNWEINEIIAIDITKLENITSNKIQLLLEIEKLIKEKNTAKLNSKEFLNQIMRDFNKDIDTSLLILEEYRKIQKELEDKIHDACKLSTLENINSRLASRIYEFSKRDETEWDNELLPRLAEFYINKEELTDDVKELLSPLYKYWDTHIIPQVTSILDNEKFSLPVLCDELSFFSKFFSPCLQDSTLQDAL